jgi:hypothetical protein
MPSWVKPLDRAQIRPIKNRMRAEADKIEHKAVPRPDILGQGDFKLQYGVAGADKRLRIGQTEHDKKCR